MKSKQTYKVIKANYTIPPTRGITPLLIPILEPQDTVEHYVKEGDVIEVTGSTVYLIRDGERRESSYFPYVIEEWFDYGCLEVIE